MKFLFPGHSADLPVQLGTWEGDVIISVKILKYKQVITVLVEGKCVLLLTAALTCCESLENLFFFIFSLSFFFFFLKEDI